MDFKEDIKREYKKQIGIEPTLEEIEEINNALNSRLDMYYEDYKNGEDIIALFNEDFVDSIKQILNKIKDE